MIDETPLSIEAAVAALEAATCFSEDTDQFLTPTQIAELCVTAAQPFWSIQAESVALTARRLLDKIIHGGPEWDPVQFKREVRDMAVALQAWESSRSSVA